MSKPLSRVVPLWLVAAALAATTTITHPSSHGQTVAPIFGTDDLIGTQTDGVRVRVTNTGGAPQVTDINVGEQVLLDGPLPGNARGLFPVVNFSGGGSFIGDVPYPAGTNANDFALEATGLLNIPAAGSYVIGVNSDDGFRLRLGTDFATVSEFVGTTGNSNTRVVVNFDQPGLIPYRLTHFERAGGEFVEFYAKPGTDTSLDLTQDRLIGDTANGGLQTIAAGQFYLRDVKSPGTVNNLAAADALLRGDVVPSLETNAFSSFIDFLDGGGTGNYPNNLPFPGGSGRDDFGLEATAMVFIPMAGTYTFGNNSDDGARVQIQGQRVINADVQQGRTNAFGSITFDAPGFYDLRYLHFERGGGAGAELFAAQGVHGSFDAGQFRLVGDVANGGLAVFSPKGWRADVGGDYHDAANWRDGQVAGGAGAFASFSLVDLSADRTVNLNAPVTLGHLRLGDVDATGGPHGWQFSGVGELNLVPAGAAKPVIEVLNGTATMNVPVTGSDGFAKQGGGTLILVHPQNYTGGTTVANGTLEIDSPAALPANGTHTVDTGATLQLNSVGDNSYSQTLAGTGRILLNMSGGTTNTFLNGTNTGFTGLLELEGSGGNKLNSSGLNLGADAVIRVNPGAQLLVQSNIANDIQISGTGNTEDRGAIRLTGGSNTLSGNISLLGNATIGLEGGNISGSVISGAAGTQTLTLGTAPSSGGGSFSGSIADGIGQLAVTVNSGSAALSGNNSYSGGTTVNGGFLLISNDGALGAPSGSLTLATGGVLQNNNSTVNLHADRQVILAGGEGRIRAGWNQPISVHGQITGPGDLRIVNDGNQGVTLTNASNNYTGNTFVGGNSSVGGWSGSNLGLLVMGAANVLPETTDVRFDAGSGNTGELRLNGHSQTVRSIASVSGNGMITNSGGPAVFTVDGPATTTFSGSIQGNTQLVHAGPGTLTLTGASTHSGGTIIDGGTLVFGSGGTTSNTAAITVNDSGTLRFSRNDTWGNHLTPATAPITIHSGGVVESNNSFNALIDLTLSGGTLSANGGVNANYPTFGLKGTVTVAGTPGGSLISTTGAGSFNTVTIGDGSAGSTTTFAVADGAAASDLTVSVPLSNLGGQTSGLIKTGAGTMTLTAANTYTGPTDVQGGTLLVNGQSAATGDVTVQSDATLGGTGIIGGATIISDGAFLSPGNSAGTLTFTNDLTLEAGSVLLGDLLLGGTDSDRVVVQGNISLDGAILDGTWGGGSENIFRGTYSSDVMIWLIDNQGSNQIAGQFANTTPAPGFAGLFDGVVPHIVTIGGQLFAAFYSADFGAANPGSFTFADLSSGNDLLLLAMPEPSRAILMMLALGAVLLRRRRS